MCPFPAAWFYSAPHAFILSSGIFLPLWWHPHILAIYLLHTHDFFLNLFVISGKDVVCISDSGEHSNQDQSGKKFLLIVIILGKE